MPWCLGALIYVMDMMLWKPTLDMNLQDTVTVITGAAKCRIGKGSGTCHGSDGCPCGHHVLIFITMFLKIVVEEIKAVCSSSQQRGITLAAPLSKPKQVQQPVAGGGCRRQAKPCSCCCTRQPLPLWLGPLACWRHPVTQQLHRGKAARVGGALLNSTGLLGSAKQPGWLLGE